MKKTVWNITYVMHGHIAIEADSEDEARQIFCEMDDDSLNGGICDTDISDIWEGNDDEV